MAEAAPFKMGAIPCSCYVSEVGWQGSPKCTAAPRYPSAPGNRSRRRRAPGTPKPPHHHGATSPRLPLGATRTTAHAARHGFVRIRQTLGHIPGRSGGPCLPAPAAAKDADGSPLNVGASATCRADGRPFVRMPRAARHHPAALLSKRRQTAIAAWRPLLSEERRSANAGPSRAPPRRCAQASAPFVRTPRNGRRHRPGLAARPRPSHRPPRAIALRAQGDPPP
jgi:hypothetical protein